MHIISLTAENIKKLRAVEIKPGDKHVVQVTGANGQGKSSVLDAIYFALGGTANLPSQPIRKGEEKAFVKLDLGEIVVTRKFSAEGTTTLTVEASNGARFPSPQKMLDDLLGTLTFDPLAFMRETPKQQLEILRGLVKLEVDVDALNAKSKEAYELRTSLNREIKALEAQAQAITYPPDTPEEPVDVMALVTKLQEAGKVNALLEKRKASRDQAEREITHLEQRAAQMREEQQRLEKEIAKLEADAKALEERLKTAEPLPEPMDTQALQEKVSEASAINRAVEAKNRQSQIVIQLRIKRDASEACTETMDLNAKAVKEAIEKAPMPVQGLTFGEGEVIYNGLPLAQAGDAEQLQISTAIAMSGNPKLKVLRIKDGSLLDEHSLAILESMAEASDYQIWLERVDTSGKVGVVIEDGAVAVGKGN